MNRIYRLVYNCELGQVQVASELAGTAIGGSARKRLQRPLAVSVLGMALALGLSLPVNTLAAPLPTGQNVLAGNATFTTTEGTTYINQSSRKAFIDWSSFSIADGNAVAITVPSRNAVTLNRVIGTEVSRIDGDLSSNGHVFLLNSNGVIFGRTARVDVRGLVAAAATYTEPQDIEIVLQTDRDLGAGTLPFHFDLSAGNAGNIDVLQGAVINSAGGPIVLLGERVFVGGRVSGDSLHLLANSTELAVDSELLVDRQVQIKGSGDSVALDYVPLSEQSSTLDVATHITGGNGLASVSTAGRIAAQSVYVSGSSINMGGQTVASSLVDIAVAGNQELQLSGAIEAGQITLSTNGAIRQTGGQVSASELILAGVTAEPGVTPLGPSSVSLEAADVLSGQFNAIEKISGQVAGNVRVHGSVLGAGGLSVGGNADFESNGALTLGNVDVGGRLSASGSGIAQADGALLTAGNGLRLDSTGDIAVNNLSVNGSLTVGAGGGLTIKAGTVNDGDASLTSTNALQLFNFTADGISATGTGIQAESVSARTDDLSLMAGTGSLVLKDVHAARDLTAAGSSISQTGWLRAGRKAVMTGTGVGEAVSLRGLDVGALDAVSEGVLTLAGSEVAGLATLTSKRAMSLADLTTGGLRAESGSLTQTGALNVLGTADLTSSGDINLHDVTAALLTVSTRRDLRIDNSAGLTLSNSTVDGVADLRSDGAVDVIGLTAGSLLTRTVGGLTVANSTVAGGASLSSDQRIRLNDVQVGRVEAFGTGITANNLSTTAGHMTLMANAGTLALHNVISNQNLTAHGHTIEQSGSFIAGGLADLRSTTSLNLRGLVSHSLKVVSEEALTLDSSSVVGHASLSSDSAMQLTDLTAGAVTAKGQGITVTRLTANGLVNLDAKWQALLINDMNVTAGGLEAKGISLTQTGALNVLGTANLSSSGNMTLHDVKAQALTVATGGDLTIDNNAELTLLTLSDSTVAGRAALSSGGALSVSNLASGTLTAEAATELSLLDSTVVGDATLSSDQAMRLSAVQAGSLAATAAGMTASAIGTTTGDLSLQTGTGRLVVHNIDSARNLTAQGHTIEQTGFLKAGGLADVASTTALDLQNLTVGALQADSGGRLTLLNSTVTGLADLSSGGAMSVSNLRSGALTADAATDLALLNSTVAGDVTLSSDQAMQLLNVTADSLSATGHGLRVHGVTTAGDATLQAGAGNLRLGGVNVGGQLVASGQDIRQWDGSFESDDGTGAAPSTGGGEGVVVAGQLVLRTDGDITLDGPGNRFSGPVSVSGQQVALQVAGPLSLSEVQASGLQAITDGALRLDDATITGATRLAGHGVDLGTTRIGGAFEVDSTAGIGQHGTLQVQGNTRMAAASDIQLDDAGNDFVGSVAAQGTSIRLVDANALTLTGLDNRGGTGAVDIDAGGPLRITGSGIQAGSAALALRSQRADIQINQSVSAGAVRMQGATGIGLGASVTATDHLRLQSGGAVTQTAGTVSTAMLDADVAGIVDLQQANRIQALGDLSMDTLKLVNAVPLTVVGTVRASDALTLDVRGGNLDLQGRLEGNDVRLMAAGDITQASGSRITAASLSGRAGGQARLGTDNDVIDNQVAVLGDFSAHGGFSLTNGRTLTLQGLNGSAFSVDAGSSPFYLNVQGGDILQSGRAPVYAGDSMWVTSGQLGQPHQPIRLISTTGKAEVRQSGPSSTYFDATTVAGRPMVIISAINLPVVELGSREQNSAIERLPYVDIAALDAEYRPFGLVQPGIRLPDDQQQDCDAGDPDADCAL